MFSTVNQMNHYSTEEIVLTKWAIVPCPAGRDENNIICKFCEFAGPSGRGVCYIDSDI